MCRRPFVVSQSNHERTYDTVSEGGEGKGEGRSGKMQQRLNPSFLSPQGERIKGEGANQILRGQYSAYGRRSAERPRELQPEEIVDAVVTRFKIPILSVHELTRAEKGMFLIPQTIGELNTQTDTSPLRIRKSATVPARKTD